PHGASQRLAFDLLDLGVKVVDLSADFRLHDVGTYERWYKQPHSAPELIARFVYGLPELNRDEIAKADAVAAPGCYPTAAALALAPLVHAGVIETSGIIVDAASGVSGAGRGLSVSTHFGSANEDFKAYGLLDHRHTPEIEQAVGAQVLFTPHLAPMTRGILASCYARPMGPTSTPELLDSLTTAYAGEPFIVVSANPPSTKAAWGSNTAYLSVRYDERTGWVLVLAAIDNLVKGASGQALQCANLMLDLDETAGLPRTGIAP
ncbi:MAG: N-acetyl-gamma-glutamyl-phosphate reductase, partial [Actinomycetota bacterium]|nr:N-acetyl-gamma-glutamyl-phosphate reductase [Actinomycetota bacterium]